MNDNADTIVGNNNEQRMYCRQCGYNLRHLRSHECPECGTAFDSSNGSTFNLSPNGWKLKRRLKWACAMIVAMISIFVAAVVLDRNIDKLTFRYAAWSLEGATISKMYGYRDGLIDNEIRVTSITLNVRGKGLMHFSCDDPREFFNATDVHLGIIGPYDIGNIKSQLLASGKLTKTQQRELAKYNVRGINVGINGEFSDLTTKPIKSIQDAVNQYDEILERIEELLEAEDVARPVHQ